MKSPHDQPDFIDYSQFAPATDRYSAKHIVKPVNFICVAPNARHVFLMGDFNGWDPNSHPMKRRPDGTWLIQVALSHGHHHYLFLVDGEVLLDPRAHGIARNHRNEKVSLLAVS